jgi:hypothetical protein
MEASISVIKGYDRTTSHNGQQRHNRCRDGSDVVVISGTSVYGYDHMVASRVRNCRKDM